LDNAFEWRYPSNIEKAFSLKGAQLAEAIFHRSKKRKTVENRHQEMFGWMAVHVGQNQMDKTHANSVYSLPGMPSESELSHLKGTYIGASHCWA
jgi:hypothetical protein